MSPDTLPPHVRSWLREHEAEVRETLRELAGGKPRPDRAQVLAMMNELESAAQMMRSLSHPFYEEKLSRLQNARRALLALIFPEVP